MSSTQPTLDDYLATPEDAAEDVPDQDAVDARSWADTESVTNSCLSCGGDVPAQVARVIGDNSGCLPACPNCTYYSSWTRAARDERGLSLAPGER